MSPLDHILTKLQGVRREGDDFIAMCPSHDDRRRQSLSIREAEDSRVLIHCFAGCAVEDILAARGLTMRDLFSSNGGDDTRPAMCRWIEERGSLAAETLPMVRSRRRGR